MNLVLQPWHLLLVILAEGLNREQRAVVEYLRTENQILMEMHGMKRIPLGDDQRRRLAIKGKLLGRKALQKIATIVTPDTILRWHRQLVAAKWDYSDSNETIPGRPSVSEDVVPLVLRTARENPTWGCDRIPRALANLGYQILDRILGNMFTVRFKVHGIEPAPERPQ